jgi:hypothetical protein
MAKSVRQRKALIRKIEAKLENQTVSYESDRRVSMIAELITLEWTLA